MIDRIRVIESPTRTLDEPANRRNVSAGRLGDTFQWKIRLTLFSDLVSFVGSGTVADAVADELSSGIGVSAVVLENALAIMLRGRAFVVCFPSKARNSSLG